MQQMLCNKFKILRIDRYKKLKSARNITEIFIGI